MKKILLIVCFTLAIVGVNNQTFGQTYVQQAISYNWETPTVNVSTTSCDDCFYTLSLPFTFTFFCNNYTSVSVNTNGLMTFGAGSAAYGNVCIPNAAAPNNFIAAYWDDLVFYYACAPTYFRYQTFGTAPNRRFVVSWIGFVTYSDYFWVGCGYYLYTEIKLFETSNNIEIHHQTSSAILPNNSATIGIENSTGLVGYQAACNTSVMNNVAWRWTPTCSGLPIELVSFTATCDEASGNRNIQWITASEINNQDFVIERSFDAINWKEVHREPGAGNSNTQLSYSWTDTEILDKTVYYRLTQIDFDGQSETFDVVSASCSSIHSAAIVFPNPNDGNFTLRFADEAGADVTLLLIDQTGRIVMTKIAKATGSDQLVSFNVEDLTSGLYFIRIEGKKSQALKVVVK